MTIHKKICSIDVGIRNLAICILEISPNTFLRSKIIYWKCISLLDEVPKVLCDEKNCSSNSKYTTSGSSIKKHYCLKHIKKYNYLIPSAYPKNINKLSKQDLEIICKKLGVLNFSHKKTEMLKQIREKKCNPIKTIKTNDYTLVDIGKNIWKIFDEEKLYQVDEVIIENQISPIANRMKTIQGMLSQYFIMRNIENIQFVSSANKLKVNTEENNNPSNPNSPTIVTKSNTKNYKNRKELGIIKTTAFLNHINKIESEDTHKKWDKVFELSKKKDDLADCLLQGLWWINK
jgi:hypothetical protein